MKRNIRRPLLLVVAALGCCACGNQSVGPSSDSPAHATALYMGETPPTTEAVVFSPGVVSKTGRYEYAVSIHPDGDRLLFTAEAPTTGALVYESRFAEGRWSVPRPANLTDGAMKHEMEAFFSPDGSRVRFAPYAKGMDVRIWTAEVTPTGFRNPRPLESPIADDPSFYPVEAADGSLYYTNLAQRAVFRATFSDGRLAGAEPAGLERGGHAFPAPDGSFVLVDSASIDSDEQRDIYVSFREDDGSWGTPHPLGPEVNTEHSETCPALSPDGAYLFFSRYDEPGGVSQIYWISSEVIRAEEPV